MKYSFLLIGGPTASKKTELAIHIASKIPAVIINADSMQFYQDFKILNNRPNSNQLKKNEFKLFGNIQIPNFPNLGWWNKIIEEEISNTIKRNKLPIIVGGTGLYLSALEKKPSFVPKIKLSVKQEIEKLHEKFGLDFLYKKLKDCDQYSYKKLNQNDTHRILRALEVKKSTGKTLRFWQEKNRDEKSDDKKKYYYIVLTPDKKDLYYQINLRFMEMIKKGAIKEVEIFKKKNVNQNHPIYKMIGLKYLVNYLENKITLEEAISLSQRDTRRYAKRQITWFKNQTVNSNRLSFDDATKFFSLSTCKNYFLF